MKKYTHLQVPWHTHLYRAGVSLFVVCEKPWHTHIYRAWLSLCRDSRYAPIPKKHTNLHVPWHTHLYRAGVSLFVVCEKPWHTHIYRAWRALCNDSRYVVSPKVSIIIPVYNAESCLARCLNSILNQTLKNIEIICIDDKSTDNSLLILRGYAKKNRRLKIIALPENGGLAIAKNEGLAILRGNYFAFMDPSDFYPDDSVLEKLYTAIQEKNVQMVGGSLRFCDINGKPEGENDYEVVFKENKMMTFKEYQLDSYFQRFLFSAHVLREKNLSFPDFRKYHEAPFLVQFMEHVESFYALTDETYAYCQNQKRSLDTLEEVIDFIKTATLELKICARNGYAQLYARIQERINNEGFKQKCKVFLNNANLRCSLRALLSEIDNPAQFTELSPLLDTKVSVIIPVYNVAKYLPRCLDSIIGQTLSDIEIICIDDKSTDNSLEVLREYGKKDKRMKIIALEKNSGAAFARNAGLAKICGEFFVFMDPDDFYPNSLVLEKLYMAIQQNGVQIAGGSLRFCDKHGNPISNNFPEAVFSDDKSMDFEEYQFDYYYQRFMYSTRILQRNNLCFPNFRRYQDPPFFVQYMAHARKFYALKAETYVYCYEYKASTAAVGNLIDMTNGIKLELQICKEKKYQILHDRILNRINDMGFINKYKNHIRDANIQKTLGELILEIENAEEKIPNLIKLILPKVSVIIPVYNVEKYLSQCLDSVTKQTIEALEIICVNDGSTDSSLEILKKYAEKDSRIQIISQKNAGSAAARNSGIRVATGQYVGFIDSDDWIDLNYYEKLYRAACSQNADIARCGYTYSYGTNDQCEETFNSKINAFSEKGKFLGINDHTVVVYNAIYRRSFLLEKEIAYFDDLVRHYEDIFYTARATALANRVVPVSRIQYYYRKNQRDTVSDLNNNGIKESVESLIHINEMTMNFINSHQYPTTDDYVVAYKRCLWRYNDFFKRALVFENFTKQLQLNLFNSFLKSLRTFKEPNAIVHETYYSPMQGGNFKRYLRFLRDNLNEVIISLTSYPARIRTVHLTIETLLNQTKKADKVILWLANSQFPNQEKNLPDELLCLKNKGLKISWCEDIKSYKKLIPTLKQYPNALICTADDDILYSNNWLKELYGSYLENPNVLHCTRMHRITFENKKIKPYKQWEMTVKHPEPSFLNFFTGSGGVLYKRTHLHDDIFCENLFMKLCPYGDDIWFWAMAVLKGTKTKIVNDYDFRLTATEGTQECALWHENVNGGRNDEQLRNVFAHYPQILKKIQKEYYGAVPELFKPKNIFSITSKDDYIVLRFLYLTLNFKNKRKIRQREMDEQRKKMDSILWNVREINKAAGIQREAMKVHFDALRSEIGMLDAKTNEILANLQNGMKEITETMQTQIHAMGATKMEIETFRKEVASSTDIARAQNEKHYSGSKQAAEATQKQIANIARFQMTMSDCEWLVQHNFSPGSWAMDNAGLFSVFRVLNNMRPKNILEFGLGQSSKLVHQYAHHAAHHAKAKTIEHDQEWMDFFLMEISGYDVNIEKHDIAEIEIDEGKKTLTYTNLDNLLMEKYDFILVDGPLGYEKFPARPQILDFVQNGMPEKFCILVDDVERNGEKETVNRIQQILNEQKREFLIREYVGEKNRHAIICSPDLRFLTTL